MIILFCCEDHTIPPVIQCNILMTVPLQLRVDCVIVQCSLQVHFVFSKTRDIYSSSQVHLISFCKLEIILSLHLMVPIEIFLASDKGGWTEH